MTSEHAVDDVPAAATDDNPTKADDQPEPLADPPVDEPEPVKAEVESQGEGEKPKRAVRKKRESAAASEAMDTQPLFEQPIILEGKRSRKPTSRLELSDLSPPKKELSIPQGHGKPLGEIEYINYQITHAPTDALSHMRNVCFGRRASKTNIQQTLREFNGFEFAEDSEDYQRHLSNLNKLKKDQLRSISDILGLPAEGRNDEHAERILAFLMNPVDEGKAIPERKMSMRTPKSTPISSKESIHTDEEDEENDNEQDDDYRDELFNEEEDEDAVDTDDDYIGSDDDYGVHNKDDPDDFVYQPGKKTPKKRASLKRSRSGTAQKRKRNPPRTAQRGRKKPKVAAAPTAKDDNLAASTEPVQALEQVVNQPPKEPQTSDPTPATSDQHDTTTNKSDSDMIASTS